MRKIVERIAFALYLVGVLFYFLRYNNFDSGVPGYLAALQLEWFGSADEKITTYAVVAVYLIPYFVALAIIRKLVPPARDPGGRPQLDWPEKLLSAAAVVAILAVSAHLFLESELESLRAAKIYQLDLNEPAKLPEDARFVSAVGRIQSKYLYVIERVKSGRTERAMVYAPFTGKQWTPDQPVAYVVLLHYGYATERSASSTGVRYSVDDADRDAAKPFAAEISTSGVPLAVARSYAQDGHLRLADKLHLFEQTAFPNGKPRNKYEDFMPLLPLLLPAGLPISAVLLVSGLAGWRWQRRQSAA